MASIIKRWPKLMLYGDLNMRPFRNIWLLEEINLPYNHIVCKPWSRVAKSIHPLGKVPALLVEDFYCSSSFKSEKFVIIESIAINTYLGDVARDLSSNTKHNNNIQSLATLVPIPSTPQRAKYDSLALFIATEIDSQSLWIHRKHEALGNVFGSAPVAVKEAKRQFDNALDVMIDEIGDKEYILPSGFSALDIVFAHCCNWAQQISWLEKSSGSSINSSISSTSKDQDEKITQPKALDPKLAEYLKRCRSRPAFIRANELRKNQVYDDEKKDKNMSRL